MLDLNKIKLILCDRHKTLILRDMQGPVDINGGIAFAARHLDISGMNEDHLIKILSDYPIISFYELTSNYVRFASITKEELIKVLS